MLIDDAIMWFEQELYKIQMARCDWAFCKNEVGRLSKFYNITESNLQYIKDLKELGVKKVNVIE